MQMRRANATLEYQGTDITSDIASDLKSISYEEGFGQADTISVDIQDRNKKWMLKWKPKTGERLIAGINTTNWQNEGDISKLTCGLFLVDDLEYTGPPSTLSLKGISLPADTSFIGVPHSRTWRNITIKDLIASMLPKSITLSWQTSFNFILTFAEQSEVPDLEYISGLCEKYGLRLKVLNNRLVVFSAFELDTQTPIRKITPDDLGNLGSYAFRHTATRTQYDACTVKYQNAAQGQELSYTYPQGGNPQKVYVVTTPVFSIAEAEAVAKAAFWSQNMIADSCELTLSLGDTRLYAGRNIEIEGYGDSDGIYGIDASVHEVSGDGYKTSITLHRVITMPEAISAPQASQIKIGDTVNFSGGNHYPMSIATTPVGGNRTAGTAKVTNIAANAPHPYHLIGITSNVFGWVDASTVTKG